MEDPLVGIISFLMGFFLFLIMFLFFGLGVEPAAEFVCESHGLELIDYEIEGKSFSKVECGNKKPELQYEDYKVFTK